MLCDKDEYRKKIVANGLVKKNDYQDSHIPQGIPQGSPISDILANIYMLDFDAEMATLVAKYDAYYRRYSDDILWICPEGCVDDIRSKCHEAIEKQGRSTLSIHPKKTTETHFLRMGRILSYSGNPFSYLGFWFDGEKALYREKTISGYQRDSVLSIQSFVKRAYQKGTGDKKKGIKGNGKPLEQNLNIAQLFHKIGFPNKKYVNEQRMNDERADANFMTYHMRALRIFNGNRDALYRISDQQLVNYKKFIKAKIVEVAQKFDPTFTI